MIESCGLFIFRQFLVFKVRWCDEPKQRITEQARVIPVVETKLKLVKVTIKMLDADIMVRANNRPLKERPDVFKGVRVSNAAHPLSARVVNRDQGYLPCVK